VNLLELSIEEFTAFQEFIYKTSGIHVSERKRILLSNRIRTRLKECDIDDFGAYFKFLTSIKGQREQKHFLNVVTTHESFFFRTNKHFDWFRNHFISDIVINAGKNTHAKQIRVWSAACSTGEEAYSLAICLADQKLKLRDWKTNILATDISEQALSTAREGIYNERDIDAVNEKQRRRYFSPVHESQLWKTKPVLKELIEFKQHNLMQPIKPRQFDCIFICNVLIYFDKLSKQIVVNNLIDSLAPGGYLVTGPSEGIYMMLGDLKKHSTFLYQKQTEPSN